MSPRLVALAISGVLCSTARAEECPNDAQAQQAVAQGVPLTLPSGCVAPFNGKLLNRKMRDANRAAFAQVQGLLEGNKSLLETARAELATCHKDSATALDDCSIEAAEAAETPVAIQVSPARGWIWAAAGSGAALGPLAACQIADCGSEATPWVAAAAGSAVVILLARLVE